MNRVFIFLLFLISTPLVILGQTVHSKLLDEHGDAIPHAHIRAEKYGIGTLSNKNGEFWINYEFQFPLQLEISHIGYETRLITIKNDQEIPNSISLKTKLILGINIYADAVEDLIKEKPLFVYDYVACHDTLILLCFDRKKINNRYLVLIDIEGKEMERIPIQKARSIESDPEHRLYYTTSTEIVYFSIQNGFLNIQKRYNKSIYKPMLEQLTLVDNSTVYAKKYFENDQILMHFRFEKKDLKVDEISTIADDDAIDRLHDPHGWLASASMNEHDIRFEKMCFYKPVYAPLYRIGNEIIVLNFHNRYIEKYSIENEFIEKIDMPEEFAQPDQIVFDKEEETLYAFFEENGKCRLKPIDLEKASYTESIEVPGYSFIEKVNVSDSQLYFLYKENSSDDYKKIYKMPLY